MITVLMMSDCFYLWRGEHQVHHLHVFPFIRQPSALFPFWSWDYYTTVLANTANNESSSEALLTIPQTVGGSMVTDVSERLQQPCGTSVSVYHWCLQSLFYLFSLPNTSIVSCFVKCCRARFLRFACHHHHQYWKYRWQQVFKSRVATGRLRGVGAKQRRS